MKYREQIEAHLLKLAEVGVTGKRNTHMTHIEDLVILGGAEGIEHALDTFNSLYDELKGETPRSQRRVSVKIDGAPAVFVWSSFPGLDGPGLATKGLFAKTPKAAYNHELIDQYFGHAPDLAKKMHAMFNHILDLGIPEGQIWQGDFLYDRDSVKLKTIDDEAYYIFHPNTLVYAVPVHSEIGARMEESDIGVVWHTVYTGDSVENVTPSFSAKAENLNHVPGVFSTDPYVKSIAGEVTMTAEETAAMDNKLEEAEALAQQLTSHPQYEAVVNDEAFISSFFTVFQNATIRGGKKVPDAETFIADFTSWAVDKITSAAEKKIAGLKTERGQNAARQKMEQDLQTVQQTIEDNEDVLILIIELITLFTDIKETFTRKMDALGGFQAYLQMKSGEFRRTGQEGFAISDISGNVVKFVDRTEFSFANFSADVQKGWESNSRVQEKMSPDELKHGITQTLQQPDLNSTSLVRAYNILSTGGQPSELEKRLAQRVSVHFPDAIPEIAGMLNDISNHFDPEDWSTLLSHAIAHGLCTLPPPGKRVDLVEEAYANASKLAQQVGSDPEDFQAIVYAILQVFMEHNKPLNGVAVGKGEIFYALLLAGGRKGAVGDVEVATGDSSIEVEIKGPGARLKGNTKEGGVQGFLDQHKGLAKTFGGYLRAAGEEKAAKAVENQETSGNGFNVTGTGVALLKAYAELIPEEARVSFAKDYVAIMASSWGVVYNTDAFGGVSGVKNLDPFKDYGKDYVRKYLAKMMLDIIELRTGRDLHISLAAFAFAAYQWADKWDLLMPIDYTGQAAIVSNADQFVDVLRSGVIKTQSFAFPASYQAITGLQITLAGAKRPAKSEDDD